MEKRPSYQQVSQGSLHPDQLYEEEEEEEKKVKSSTTSKILLELRSLRLPTPLLIALQR